MKHILGFNIGNTNTMMGIFKSDSSVPIKTFTYKTDKNISSDDLGLIVKENLTQYVETGIEGIAFSSVVTEVNKSYQLMSESLFNVNPVNINSSSNLAIKIIYDNPEELGPDRIANAEAVFNEYKKDCIIIDLGTANTFCVIHEDGTFDGGLIGPGIGITIDALSEKTSKLAKIKFEKPDKFIATNTIDAIKSGFFYGYILMIKGIINEIEKLYNKNFLIILTGGLANIISKHIGKDHIFDPFLTMKGIKIIYNLNKNIK